MIMNALKTFARILLEKKEGLRDRLSKKYGITKFGPGSTGLNEKDGIYYGWSHRAICGFKAGDMVFDPNFRPKGATEEEMDNMPFKKRGSKQIKNMDDAKQAAMNFSDYVS